MKNALRDISPTHVFVLGLLAALKAAALVGMATAVAEGVVAVIAGDDWRGAVLLGLASGLLRAALTWASSSYATRAAIGAKEQLRHDLAASLLSPPAAPADRVARSNPGGRVARSAYRDPHPGAGAVAVVATVGLDELDNYYRTALPAIITAAVVPLLVGARILLADPVSAIIIVITVPLVPVFMALVGLHTQDRADAASASLQRLSDHLVELARGLPVLVGLGRVDEQAAALREVSERNRVATMGTLRTAFLSSLVLELISTISVAVVAVFVGVRLVGGDLTLEVGLLALVLAPECFAPFRELGGAFHSSQDGLAAMRRAKTLIGAPGAEPPTVAEPPVTVVEAPTVTALTVRYPDRIAPAVEHLSFTLPHGTITSIEGASGAGKSTVLAALAGLILPESGSITGIRPGATAWVPQHPHTVAPTVWQEVRLYADTDKATDAALDSLALTSVATADPAQLSPGELRRLAVARGLVRVAAGAELLLLDEPTAHLDPVSAALVEDAIDRLRGAVTVVVASHEAGVGRLADRRVVLGVQGGQRAVASAPSLAELPPSLTERVESTAPASFPRQAQGDARAASALRELAAFLRPTLGRTIAAILLGSAAALAALALTAVSGWLIVRASEEPSFMYLMVAIVGVRFFGVARAGLRYSERLVSHDAVLASVTDLRARLWTGLAARGPASRALTSGGAAIDYLVGAADRVRDLVPRVILPPAVAMVTAGASVIAVALLHAPAVPLLLLGIATSLFVGPVVALLADRRAAAGIAIVRSTVLRQFTAMVAARGDLRANGMGARMLARLSALDTDAGRLARSSAWALGLGQAVVVLACSASAVLMLPAAGGVQPAIVAVLVLVPLGLIEPFLGLVDAVQQWPALAAALRRVRAVSAPRADRDGLEARCIHTLELDELSARWPEAFEPAFGPLTARATAGEWIVVEGPSGAGKSTLLATILGYLPAASGRLLINGTDASALAARSLRSHIAWCPQESHLFDSTIRGNLLLARPASDRPSDFEMENALIKVGLGPLLASLADGLDTRVGSAGERLSGGERQRLAVARTLLARADVVLLDEPTAHLDEAGAEQLMRDLRFALRDRIVVLVSHHGSERAEGDVLLRLREPAFAAVGG